PFFTFFSLLTAQPVKISNTERELWLLGQPPLQRYLDFIEDMMVGGETADRRKLVDEWRVANDYYHELEEREARLPEQIECRGLDRSVADLAKALKAHPRYTGV